MAAVVTPVIFQSYRELGPREVFDLGILSRDRPVAFTISDLHDLMQLLEKQPEWRAELRRALLSDELLEMPQILRDLAKSQVRTEERVAGIEQQLEALAAAQVRSEERVAGIERQLEALAAAQVRTEERVSEIGRQLDELTRAIQQLTAQVSRLALTQDRIAADVGRLKGSDLERRFERFAHAYLSRWIRRAHVLTSEELAGIADDAEESGTITEGERMDLLRVDAVVRGRLRADQRLVYMVAEVSWGVGMGDVGRAAHRAGLLARSGLEAIPVVVGESITAEAQSFAPTVGVESLVLRTFDGEDPASE
ncbi:MAG: hypothetical protein ACKVVP_08320 [Chloroflexota bacterium]